MAGPDRPVARAGCNVPARHQLHDIKSFISTSAVDDQPESVGPVQLLKTGPVDAVRNNHNPFI